MEETTLSFNLHNFITIIIMVAVAYVAVVAGWKTLCYFFPSLCPDKSNG